MIEVVEGERLTPTQWAELRAGEAKPFGTSPLEWRSTDGFLALRVDGRLVATAGWTLVQVEAGGERFPVVGLGAVLVSRPHRGKGYARRVLERWLERAAELGPDRAALFCAPEKAALYARFGFAVVHAPVTAGQPGGRTVTMPPCLMWRPLRPGATWPEGPVRVPGLPF